MYRLEPVDTNFAFLFSATVVDTNFTFLFSATVVHTNFISRVQDLFEIALYCGLCTAITEISFLLHYVCECMHCIVLKYYNNIVLLFKYIS